MADKKKPPRIDMKSPDGKFGRLIQIGGTAIVVLFAVGLVFYIVTSHKKDAAPGHPVRVAANNVVTKPDSKEPKAVISLYEDFLCPACGVFEQTFGSTINKLIDIGAVAADYTMVAILSKDWNQHYSSRAGAAAYCVADESIDAFRRFHSALYSPGMQPSENDKTFPDNGRLIEWARQAGAAGSVPDCINSGKYVSMVDGLAAASNIKATPTVRINGEDYSWSTPQALVAKIKSIVGDVPGIDAAAAAAAA
ncbi:hypothetical protein BST27_23110 [Mycobacterium intermedium]|uniref:Thioredoxin-like fold domain-containing protein n=1 Tax=Mycobacterium intermedium TaxID=28445 RepID=A0A1E3S7X3_MYCIE|nr:DsbA family protein [Mycobacterium intermedium]MCV6965671.1 DsbA family protein [Mycobacterium intermedium]ODQ97742.1 hypothetical protein BHQ20_25325 [Mycobacterium intermedium]OPE47980.1 hypothetical protein BV508_19845 [Mycobacterium intermedium]ORA97105.1 hypothetical protein BST27_23110 [Mycobacterium intermedium]